MSCRRYGPLQPDLRPSQPSQCLSWRMKTPSYWRRTPNCSVRKPQIMRVPLLPLLWCTNGSQPKSLPDNINHPHTLFCQLGWYKSAGLVTAKSASAMCTASTIKWHHCVLLVGTPYSGELSREKIFVNWWKIWFSRRKLLRIACFYCAKGYHAPKFYRENFHK